MTGTMDDTDIPSHLREQQQDHYYAQQAYSSHRAAEGVERVDPLNESWQEVQAKRQGSAGGQGYPQQGGYNGQQYSQPPGSPYAQGQQGQQDHLQYQYQGQQSYGQGQQQVYNQHQGYQGTPTGIPHSISPPDHTTYSSQHYRHGQPPGANVNQNNFTATHENTLHTKLQNLHILPNGNQSQQDPAQVTEQLAKDNVNGEKTMVPPNPSQYPPLLQPMEPHLQLM
ncbi:hypothetical protein QFC24_001051 [Naganishia onofrii]|uniref:Uncharacterized protein n=1 Tax=Naganishia onofrii TaxID=1851511 RepID=A0ACC2XVJ5_9TREE|nr:hypothetical protein QFC24_001051 [Naganishia onofrii]